MLLLLACRGPVVHVDDSVSEVVTTELSYYADIKPLVDTHCTRCHNPEGLGGSDFTDPDVVVSYADVMKTWTEAAVMPPPVSGESCRAYVGMDHMALDDDEQTMLSEWVDGGAPLGDVAETVDAEVLDFDLVAPDLTLTMPAAYTPTWWDDGNPGNEYRCFTIDPGLGEDVYLTAMDPVVDNDAVVHHVVLMTVDRDSLDEEYLDPEGWDCIDGAGVDANNIIAAWAPGMMPIEFPEDHGMKLDADDVVVVQMHYFDPGDGGGPDQSGYAFETAESVGTAILMVPLGLGGFNIPAGDAAYTAGDDFPNQYADLTLHGVFPHMHKLGSAYSMTLGDECLVEGDYSFDNQLTYMWEEPVAFERGSEIDFSCTWDNSESPANPDPQDTRYGERTDEEMCFFFTLVSIGL